MAITEIYKTLSKRLAGLEFGEPVTHVYDPLQYAWPAVQMYLDKWGRGPRQVVFLGMNPGPWGMAQTGVPFGTVNLVRDWVGVHAQVGKPGNEHPKRPIVGFAIDREEVSGNRFWGWARDRFGTADAFFANHFVANYCPLVFMEASGRNRTPDKLPVAEREPLLAACDDALRQVVCELDAEWLVGIGKFAEDRARQALAGLGVRIGRILHPSPASPIANRGWAPQAEKQLRQLGLL